MIYRISVSLLFLFCAIGLVATAQTVTPSWYFTDGAGSPLGSNSITITPIKKWSISGWSNIVAEPITGVTTNGVYSHVLLNGLAFRVELAGYDNWTQTNWFSTNVTGAVPAALYTTLNTNLGGGIYAYSTGASDALFLKSVVTSNSSSITFTGSGTVASPLTANTGGGSGSSLWTVSGGSIYPSGDTGTSGGWVSTGGSIYPQ